MSKRYYSARKLFQILTTILKNGRLSDDYFDTLTTVIEDSDFTELGKFEEQILLNLNSIYRLIPEADYYSKHFIGIIHGIVTKLITINNKHALYYLSKAPLRYLDLLRLRKELSHPLLEDESFFEAVLKVIERILKICTDEMLVRFYSAEHYISYYICSISDYLIELSRHETACTVDFQISILTNFYHVLMPYLDIAQRCDDIIKHYFLFHLRTTMAALSGIVKASEDDNLLVPAFAIIKKLLVNCYNDANLKIYYDNEMSTRSHLKNLTESYDTWLAAHRCILIDYLPTFMDKFQHTSSVMRYWTAKICCSMLKHCKRVDVAPLLLTAAVQLENDDSVEVANKIQDAFNVFDDCYGRKALHANVVDNLRRRLEYFHGFDQRDVQMLDLTFQYIDGYFMFLRGKVIEVLSHEQTVRTMINRFYRIVKLDTEKVPEWARIRHGNEFSHFGLSANFGSKFPLVLHFSEFPDHGHYFYSKIAIYLQNFASLDKKHSIIYRLIRFNGGDFFHIKESLLLLNSILKHVSKKQQVDDSWTQVLTDVVEFTFKEFWDLKVTAITGCCLNIVQFFDVQRYEMPNSLYYDNLVTTCLALRAIEYVAEALKGKFWFSAKKSAKMLLEKCKSYNRMVSLCANRALFKVFRYFIDLPLYDELSPDWEENIIEEIENFHQYAQCVRSCHYNRAVTVFREFSSTTYCFEEIKKLELWSRAWPHLMDFLCFEIVFSEMRLDCGISYENDVQHIMFMELLSNIGDVIEQLSIDNDEVKFITILLIPCLSSRQSHTTQKLAVKLYLALGRINYQVVVSELNSQALPGVAPDSCERCIAFVLKKLAEYNTT